MKKLLILLCLILPMQANKLMFESMEIENVFFRFEILDHMTVGFLKYKLEEYHQINTIQEITANIRKKDGLYKTVNLADKKYSSKTLSKLGFALNTDNYITLIVK